MAEDGIPEYIRKLPRQTEDERWQNLRNTFLEYRDFLAGLRLETQEEARGHLVKGKAISKAPQWYDQEVGKEVKAWSLVNFISEHEYEHLAAKLEIARELQPSLQELFSRNGTSPEFLQKWGAFSNCVGALMAVSDAKPENIQAYRRSLYGSEAQAGRAQVKWYLHWRKYYQQELGKSIQAANKDFLSIAFGVWTGKYETPNGFDKFWFAAALRQKKDSKIKEGDDKPVKVPVKELANRLKRTKSKSNFNELLKSAPEEYPPIPPIGVKKYKKVL